MKTTLPFLAAAVLTATFLPAAAVAGSPIPDKTTPAIALMNQPSSALGKEEATPVQGTIVVLSTPLDAGDVFSCAGVISAKPVNIAPVTPIVIAPPVKKE